MAIEYLVVPAHIVADDGDCHFIDAQHLMRCWQVDPRQCLVYGAPIIGSDFVQQGLVVLRPQKFDPETKTLAYQERPEVTPLWKAGRDQTVTSFVEVREGRKATYIPVPYPYRASVNRDGVYLYQRLLFDVTGKFLVPIYSTERRFKNFLNKLPGSTTKPKPLTGWLNRLADPRHTMGDLDNVFLSKLERGLDA